ncbi:hypothetical protein ABZ897_39310 [Nonomuraea sp. NPDC046802]|uniref:RNA polymerase sigma factor n=1 Tax=Nonomuraea sp. NPDC046802 TaxID=3154919 RepID=UPI0033C93886
MSQPLIDQRSRADLIAELYDRHAAGLFAYCADQLGDLGSATDVLASVLAGVPDAEPPRAALYAFARREIHRRDVVYSPPEVDPLIDPATALVERSLRELRPHQREVLVLCAVCGLSKAELAWVLDVAPDTAEELAVGAGHHFRQSLGTGLASTGIRVPKPVADIYGALGVSPLRDVIGRLPWPEPPASLRVHFAGSRSADPGPLFVKPRWPGPPVWPQPLAEADPATSTVIFPTELLKPPPPSRVSAHEATTAPMPQLRDPLSPTDLAQPLRDPLGSLDTAEPFRDSRTMPNAGRDPGSHPERPFFLAAPKPGDGPEPFATGDVLLPGDSTEPFATGDVLLPPSRPRPARRSTSRETPQPWAEDDVLVHKGPARPAPPAPSSDFQAFSRPGTQPLPRSDFQAFSRPDTPPLPHSDFQAFSRPDPPFTSSRPDPLPFSGPDSQPFPRVDPISGPDSQPFPRVDPFSGPDSQPFPRVDPFSGPDSQPFPRVDPFSGPDSQPFPRVEPQAEGQAQDAAPLFRPRPKPARKPKEPVYRMPEPAEEKPSPQKPSKPSTRESSKPSVREAFTDELPKVAAGVSTEEMPRAESSFLAPRPVRARPMPKRRPQTGPPQKTRRRKERHYDWAWELIGFLICVAIAMIVFYSVPLFMGP